MQERLDHNRDCTTTRNRGEESPASNEGRRVCDHDDDKSDEVKAKDEDEDADEEEEERPRRASVICFLRSMRCQ